MNPRLYLQQETPIQADASTPKDPNNSTKFPLKSTKRKKKMKTKNQIYDNHTLFLVEID